MKTVLKNSLTLLICSLFVFSSCETDDSIETNLPINEINETSSLTFNANTLRNFSGVIKDKNGSAIEDATITIDDKTTTTDINGVFIIKNAFVNSSLAKITITKDSYTTLVKTTVPTTGENFINVTLLEKNYNNSITTGNNQTIELNNAASVTFDGNFKVDATNETYTGTVVVNGNYINSSLKTALPGHGFAKNASGNFEAMQTYGAISVDLEDNNGNKLNIANTHTAEIKIPVYETLASNAPQTIPLWHFNTTQGYWEQEGYATLENGVYKANVSHFSYWAVGTSFETVEFCLQLNDLEGNNLNNLYTVISSVDNGSNDGLSNTNGMVCGLIPANETLRLTVYNTACNNTPIFDNTIGPFTSNEELELNLDIAYKTISGSLKNCTNNFITNGYLKVNYANNTYITSINQGVYETMIPYCNTTQDYKIEGVNYETLETTGDINMSFNEEPLVNIGELQICDSITEFAKYTIDGGSTYYITNGNNLRVRLLENTNTLYIDYVESDMCFSMFGRLDDAQQINSYTSIHENDTTNKGFNFSCGNVSNSNNNITYHLETLGNVGDYVDLNFHGNYIDENGQQHSFSGLVHAKRDL